MKLHRATAFIFGVIAYLITVIVGLIKRAPFSQILFQGMISLVLFAAAGWSITLIVERLHNKEAESLEKTGKDGEEEQKKEQTVSDFSPLNPPVLETGEKEEQGG